MSDTTETISANDLELLDRVIRDVSRARRISREDAEDFAQSVHVRLMERNYDVFAQFAGRSSLRTYLTVVVQRMLLDWLNHLYGKWQPSVMAIRLGPFAIELERLISRDGLTFDEAIEVVRGTSGAPDNQQLRRLAVVVAQRQRRRMVADDVLKDACAVEFHDPLLVREAKVVRARTHRLLAGELRRLSSDDRELIVQRYQHRKTVQSLARGLRMEPKALYRRFDRVLRSLRSSLAEQGVTASSTVHAR